MSQSKSLDQWVNECLRKKRLSEEYANNIIAKAKNEGQILFKYVCPNCQKYHLTKKEFHVNRYTRLRIANL